MKTQTKLFFDKSDSDSGWEKCHVPHYPVRVSWNTCHLPYYPVANGKEGAR